MGMELEFKYQGSKEALSAMEAAFGGGFATIVMETTYYDTPERALSARRWTLRHSKLSPAACVGSGEHPVRAAARRAGKALFRYIRKRAGRRAFICQIRAVLGE